MAGRWWRRCLAMLMVSIAVQAGDAKAQDARARDPRTPDVRGVAEPVPDLLPAYRLLDQFNRLVTDESVRRQASIVIVAGRSGAAAAERWTVRIREALVPSEALVVAIADLQGAPKLFRGFIRSMFPKDTSNAVVLDWDGVIGRRIRGDKAPLIAAVYGADGRLRDWIALSTAQQDPATVRRLVAALN